MNQVFVFDDLVAQANNGDPAAQFNLGECYRLKNGVGSIVTAARWYSQAANQDFVPAQQALALLYLDGLEPIVWDHDARYWLERAAQNGSQESSVILRCLKEEDDDMDIADLLVEAEAGNPQAQFEIGCMLVWGVGYCENFREGRAWLRRAAIAGHAAAQAHLAGYDLFGVDDLAPDASASGVPFVRYGVFGEDGPADSGEIIKWLSLAARQKEPLAIHYLGYCYHCGIGVMENQEQAVACVLQAAQMGLSQAQYLLAQFYQDGFGLAQNLEQAESWFKAAADQGHKEAKKYRRDIDS
jgi:TPR repeat protein